MDVYIRGGLQVLSRASHHFWTDIDAVDLAEHGSQGPSHPTHTAADLENPHSRRLPALADFGHFRQDLILDIGLSGCEEGILVPTLLARVDVVQGILACPAIPVATHLAS